MKSLIINWLVALALFLLIISCSDKKGSEKAVPKYLNIDLSSNDWSGMAISYSGYREGQHPDKDIYPSQSEILEDLRIIERKWKIIRTYGADQHGSDILEVISREKINLKVLLGIWLFSEPTRVDDNRIQINKS